MTRTPRQKTGQKNHEDTWNNDTQSLATTLADGPASNVGRTSGVHIIRDNVHELVPGYHVSRAFYIRHTWYRNHRRHCTYTSSRAVRGSTPSAPTGQKLETRIAI